MMTTVVCTECGDSVEVTSRSVVLPFVCLKCDSAERAFLSEVSDIAEPKLSEEFASVDNTTTLIADLEQQLKEAQELAKSRLEEIEYTDRLTASYRKQLTATDEEVQNLDYLLEAEKKTVMTLQGDLENERKAGDALEREKDELEDTLVGYYLWFVETISQLGQRLQATRNTADFESHQLKLRLADMESQRDLWRRSLSSAQDLYRTERAKTWWTKLWER